MQIIHGENNFLSHQFLLRILDLKRQEGREVTTLDGGKIITSDLEQAISSTTLFGQLPQIVVENLLSRRPSNARTCLIDMVKKNQDQDLILYDTKEVNINVTDFPSAKIQRFDLPPYLFDFLDSFSLADYHRALNQTPPEQLFASLVTRTHKLLLSKNGLPQSPKIDRLAQKFTSTRLENLIASLLNIDYQQKTSTSPHELSAALDLLLLTL